jgi:hypothetical protein
MDDQNVLSAISEWMKCRHRSNGGPSYDRPHGLGCLAGRLVEIGAPLLLVCILAASWWVKGAMMSAVIAAVVLMWRAQPREKSALRFRPVTQEKSRMSRRVSLLMVLAAFGFAMFPVWHMASRPERPSAPSRIKWAWPDRSAFTLPPKIAVGDVLSMETAP